MEHETEKKFPTNSKDYKLYEEVGEGVSATVYRALCIPLNEVVVIKVLDLEKCNNDLDCIRREVQTMTLIDHPNVLRAHCSFTADHSLWVVMPYMAGGSALHLIKSAFPEGFEEPVIATLLREVLKALVYLHSHGHIHRDVKAGNILIDANGAVKLADFGVSACMFDAGDRQRSRNTFVGTPCWMAPEVMQQLHGYDFKADIWSFGITALELARGHAPFSKYPPMKVLLMTLQNAPPGLDYERDKRFSKPFKEMISTCLVKDPKKRPTSEKLLKHSFFKNGRTNEYLAKSILGGLPPLGDLFRQLKCKEANFLLQNKVLSEDKEQLSQQEYIRGISAWNFNLDDLKSQAALLDTSDGILRSDDIDHKVKGGSRDVDCQQERLSCGRINNLNARSCTEERVVDLQYLDSPFASSFPDRPLQALKSCFDVCDNEMDGNSPSLEGQSSPDSVFTSKQSGIEDQKTADWNGDNLNRSISVPSNISTLGRQKFASGSLLSEHVLFPCSNIAVDPVRNDLHWRCQPERNHSGPLFFHPVKDLHNLLSASIQEESIEEKIIQHKGRFKITSADTGPKVALSGNNLLNQFGGAQTGRSTISAAAILPSLSFLLQQNAMQKEQLMKIITYAEQSSGFLKKVSDASASDVSQIPATSGREKELKAYTARLQQHIINLAEEVQRLKMKNTQLEQQINGLVNKDRSRKVKGHGKTTSS